MRGRTFPNETPHDVWSTRVLWTGSGFAVLMLIGISACALVPPTSHASAQPSGLSHAFTPIAPMHAGRSTALRPLAGWAGASIPSLPGHHRPTSSYLRQAALPRPRGATKMMAAVGEAPNVKVGDQVPDVSLDSGFPPESVKLRDLTKGKRVVLVGLPGAFRTCPFLGDLASVQKNRRVHFVRNKQFPQKPNCSSTATKCHHTR